MASVDRRDGKMVLVLAGVFRKERQVILSLLQLRPRLVSSSRPQNVRIL